MGQQNDFNLDEGQSILDLPDEEIEKLDLSFLDDEAEEETTEEAGESQSSEVDDDEAEEETETEESSDDSDEEDNLPEDEDTEEETDEEESESDEEQDEDESDTSDDDETSEKDTKDSEDNSDESDSDNEDQSNDNSVVNYEAEYKKILAPFKASGRMMQVKSAEEAIQLMQMGADYNRKMAGLKPGLKTLKMLENEGLLDEDKLSYLIDLDKGNPEAVNKLIKEKGIDPLEIDTDKASDYKPGTYTVDDRQLELDTVLDSIKDTPHYSNLVDVVSNKWDGASKNIVANSPQILTVINDHMQSGIYDLISSEVERERAFGRLQDMSDLEAYKQVGDALNARGAFDHLAQNQGQNQQSPNVGKEVTPKPKPAAKKPDPQLTKKKRAASSTKAKPASAPSPDAYNPLKMSDEEYMKQFDEKFL